MKTKSLAGICFLVLVLLGIFFYFDTVGSQQIDIVITEIARHKTKKACDWVEIYNRSNKKIDISGWYLWKDKNNHPINPYSKDGYNNSGKINKKEFALLVDNPQNLLSPSSTQKKCNNIYNIPTSTTVFKTDFDQELNNSGEKIGLKKKGKSFSKIVEKFNYKNTEDLTGSSDTSLERQSPNDLDYTSDNWNLHPTSSTPGRVNSSWETSTDDINTTTPKANIISSSTVSATSSFKATSSIESPTFQWNLKTNKKIQKNNKESITYNYDKPGNKKINLITQDKQGAIGVTSTEIEVLESPQAKINISTTNTYAGEDISLNANSSSVDNKTKIKSYLWQLGNGTTNNKPTTTTSYTSSGTYRVKLTITDQTGGSDTVAKTINIKENNSSSNYHKPGNLLLNEILTNPADEKNEWVEIYNSSSQKINLEKWVIEDDAPQQVANPTDTIQAKQREVIEWGSSYLNNSGDVVKLKYNTSTQDKIAYGDEGSINTLQEGETIVRDPDNKDNFYLTNTTTKGQTNPKKPSNNTDNNQNNSTETDNNSNQTKGSSDSNDDSDSDAENTSNNSSDTTTSHPIFDQEDIVINEVNSDSASGKEWVELYNTTNNEIDLADWIIKDPSGNERRLQQTISKKGYSVIENDSSFLNNGGDKIILESPKGKIIDQLIYGKWSSESVLSAPEKKETLAKVPRTVSDQNSVEYKITKNITKGYKNRFPQQKNNPPSSSTNQNKDTKSSAYDFLHSPAASTTKQVNKDIIIQKVLPNPKGADKHNELIVIKNNSDSTANLKNWKLKDRSGSTYNFPKLLIKPKHTKLLKRSETKIALNNNSREVVKLISPKNNLIDKLTYSKSNEGKFYSQKTTDKTKSNKNQPTNKKDSNSSREVGGYFQLDNAANLKITEIHPEPRGSSKLEFIEIYNPTNQNISLHNLKIDDQKGGSQPYQITSNIELKPKKYFVLSRADTGIALNNNGDQARIMYPNQMLIDKIDYEQSKEGASFDGAKWSYLLTPGKKNKIVQQETYNKTRGEVNQKSSSKNNKNDEKKNTSSLDYTKTKLGNIDNFKEGDKLITQGVVTVKPGVFSSRYFYIQGSPGVQVYNHKQSFPSLSIGDQVEVTGELSHAYGEWRIKTDDEFDIRKIDHLGSPQIKQIDSTKLGEKNEGKLVKVEGKIVQKKDDSLLINDTKSEAKVELEEDAAISFNKLKQGATAQIKGIVSQDQQDHVLLPRKQSDIEILESNTASAKDKTGQSAQKAVRSNSKEEIWEKYLFATAGVIILILLTLYLKQNFNDK